MQEEQILCACSAYEQKYYLNPRYASLPSAIQDEPVSYTHLTLPTKLEV